MLIEIYCLLAGFTFILTILSFLRKEIFSPAGRIIMMWLCFLLFASMAMMSAQIETSYCENVNNSSLLTGNLTNYTSSWSCNLYSYESVPLIYFWGGFGLIMFVYAVIMTIAQVIETLKEEAQQREEQNENL